MNCEQFYQSFRNFFSGHKEMLNDWKEISAFSSKGVNQLEVSQNVFSLADTLISLVNWEFIDNKCLKNTPNYLDYNFGSLNSDFS